MGWEPWNHCVVGNRTSGQKKAMWDGRLTSGSRVFRSPVISTFQKTQMRCQLFWEFAGSSLQLFLHGQGKGVEDMVIFPATQKKVKVPLCLLGKLLRSIRWRERNIPLQYFLILSYICWVIAPQSFSLPPDSVTSRQVRHSIRANFAIDS